MNKIEEQAFPFSTEEVKASLKIWTDFSVSLRDIRHNLLAKEQPIIKYRLPACTFLYINGAKGEVLLDAKSYTSERFGIFHAAKGTELSLFPQSDWLEYYLLMYQPSEPSAQKKEYENLLRQSNPFESQYAFAPENPVFFSDLLRRMYEAWKDPTFLDYFYEKTCLYQLVHEIYREMTQKNLTTLQPDAIAMARRYIDEHYRQTITVAGIAEAMGISTRQLSRVFHEATGRSTQDYILYKRLEAARRLLSQEILSLKEIALAVGFNDEFYFSRLFKMKYGEAPLTFRRNSAKHKADLFMESPLDVPYNGTSRVSDNKLNAEGVKFMFKHIKSSTIMAAALSLSLVLSACGEATENTEKKEDSSASSAISSNVEKLEANETRIMKTDKGEVEIPADPQKIMGISCVTDLKSLDANYIDLEGKDHLTYFSDDYNWEELMALEPDLIIASYYEGSDEYIEQCKKIAPTVVFDDYADPIDKHLFVAEASNRLELAQENVKTYNKQIETSIQQFKDAGVYGKKIAIIQYTESGDMYSYGNVMGRGGSLLFNTLGFNATDIVQEKIIDGDEYYLSLSMETLPEYVDADYIIVMQADESTKALYENGVWQTLNAVQDGRYFEITMDEYMQYIAEAGLVQVTKQAEIFTERILAATK